MTGFDFATLAREAREQVRPGEPPLDAITTQPARPRGRWIAFGAAAAVVLVIGTVVALPRGSSGPEPTSPVTTSPTAPLSPPAGMRWLAVSHLMVAIPGTWSDSQLGCETEPHDAVVYDVGFWNECQGMGVGLSRFREAVQIVKRGDLFQSDRRRLHVPVPGTDAVRTPPYRQWGVFRMVILPRTGGSALVVQTRQRRFALQLGRSVTRPPQGYVIPPVTPLMAQAAAVRALRSVGLVVTVTPVRSPYRRGAVVASDPPFGTPIAAGSAVNLQVSSGSGQTSSVIKALRRQHWQIGPANGEAEYPRSGIAKRDIFDGRVLLRRVTVPGLIDRRLVWMSVSARGFTFISGPCCTPHASTGLGRTVNLYDAGTGELIYGTQF
jgi:hypothetical protein